MCNTTSNILHQALVRNASIFLHHATFGHFYFKQVIIVIPVKWPKRANVEVVGDDLFSASHVQIRNPSGKRSSYPFTHNTAACGETGDNVQLRTDYLKHLYDKAPKKKAALEEQGDPGKKLLHFLEQLITIHFNGETRVNQLQ